MQPDDPGLQPLDPRVVLAWRLKHGAVAALVVVAAVVGDLAPRAADASLGVPPGVISGSVAALAAAWVVVVPALVYRHWRVRFTDRTVELHHGVVVRTTSTVPYFRLQHVDITRSLFDRLVGLAVLTLHSAAATTDATIPGLTEPDADRVRLHLLAHAGHDDGV